MGLTMVAAMAEHMAEQMAAPMADSADAVVVPATAAEAKEAAAVAEVMVEARGGEIALKLFVL